MKLSRPFVTDALTVSAIIVLAAYLSGATVSRRVAETITDWAGAGFFVAAGIVLVTAEVARELPPTSARATRLTRGLAGLAAPLLVCCLLLTGLRVLWRA